MYEFGGNFDQTIAAGGGGAGACDKPKNYEIVRPWISISAVTTSSFSCFDARIIGTCVRVCRKTVNDTAAGVLYVV